MTNLPVFNSHCLFYYVVRSPNSMRRASSSDTDANYNDTSNRNNQLHHQHHRLHHQHLHHMHQSPQHMQTVHQSPQHLQTVHQSPQQHLQLNGRSSPAPLRLSNASDCSRSRLAATPRDSRRDSRRDSGSVDLETPPSMSPKSPLEAMLNSLTHSTGSLSLTHSSTASLPRSQRGCDSPRKPVPQPRSTKHSMPQPTPLHHHQLSNSSLTGFPNSTSSLDQAHHPHHLQSNQLHHNSNHHHNSSGPHSLSQSADSLNSASGDHHTNHHNSTHHHQQLNSHHQLSREDGVDRIMSVGDVAKEYSETYSKEWPGGGSNPHAGGDKPPTPPLHRFPSWESRIYQVSRMQ